MLQPNHPSHLPLMFPLLDLDDDALAATLGFTDPRTLCATTMTCRRLRILADAAWVVLDKHIPNDRREGGGTPRERVLSSFVVHQRKSWLEDIDLKAENLQKVTPNMFRAENYLLYVRMTGHPVNNRSVVSFFLNVSDAELRTIADFVADNIGSIEVPIKKEQLTGKLSIVADLVQMYHSNTGIYHKQSLEHYIKGVFSNIDIAIVALNRRTLKRHIFFQGDPKKIPTYNPDVRFSGGNSEEGKVDVEAPSHWSMTTNEGMLYRFLTLQFYFKGSKFGLKFSNGY